MSKTTVLFIRLDTHKESSQMAYCEDSPTTVPIDFGRIKSTKQAFIKLARHLQSKYPKDFALRLRSRSLWVLDLPTPHQTWPRMLRRLASQYRQSPE